MTVKNVRLKNQSGEQLIPDVGIPSQSGNNGKVLGTNGSNLVWVTQQGGGSSYTAGDGIDITNDVISAKIATSVSSTSTNGQSVGAKLFYDTVGDIETLINAL